MENILITVLLVFVAVTVLLFVFVIIRSFGRKAFLEKDVEFMARKWMEICGGGESDPRHAIMEADKLLDYALKKKGYGGSLGDKLQKAKILFSNVNAVWDAHRVRNRIAHEMDYHVSSADAKRVLSQFKTALRDLGLKI